MDKKILIGYYTKTGTTSKVCEVLKLGLSNAGFPVEMKPFSEISSIKIYDVVVIAAPINGMQWVEPAKRFIADNEAELKNKDVVAIFISYVIRSGNKFWRNKIVKGVERLTKSIQPIIIKDFGGVVDKEFPLFVRWIFGIRKGTSPDASDVKEVEIFVSELVNRLS